MESIIPTKPLAPPRPPEQPRPARKRRRGNWRKTLFRLHGWVGLNLGLLLFVICFSGSVATLSHEIDWLLNPAIRAEAREAPYAWSAMHATLADAFPQGQNLGVYAPIQPGFAAHAYVSLPDGLDAKGLPRPLHGQAPGAYQLLQHAALLPLLPPPVLRR